jgi:hypothetical protein
MQQARETKDWVVVTLKVKAANPLLTPFVRLLGNGHLSESETSQNIQSKYTTTSVKGQRKEGRKEGGRRRSYQRVHEIISGSKSPKQAYKSCDIIMSVT